MSLKEGQGFGQVVDYERDSAGKEISGPETTSFPKTGALYLGVRLGEGGTASASCGIMGSSPTLCVFIISPLKEAPAIDDLSGLFQLPNSPYLRRSVMQGAHSPGIGLHRPLPLPNCITAMLPRVNILSPPRAPTPPSFPSQNFLV